MADSSGGPEASGEPAAPIPLRPGYGEGAYRRSIRLEARDDLVEAELADDFHRFAVRVRHDGARVLEIEARDVRVPWTSCPGAVAPIRALEGEPLTRELHAIVRASDPATQCTHILDLASVAIAHAARVREGGAVRRHYAAWLPDRVGGVTRPTLRVDGELALRWTIEGAKVVEADPDRFVGLGLQGRGFGRFLIRDLVGEPDLAEAASVLRRAIFIGMGRRYAFDEIKEARSFARVVGSACHTFHPDRVDAARRVVGSVRDFPDPDVDPLDAAD